MVFFGEPSGGFGVVELPDRFGGVLEGWVVFVDNDLGDDGGDLSMLVFLDKGIVDGLGEPIADLALAHGDSSF